MAPLTFLGHVYGTLGGAMFPVANLLFAGIVGAPLVAPSEVKAKPFYNQPQEHLAVILASLPKLVIAVLCWNSLSLGAFAGFGTRSWYEAVAIVFLRDLVINYVAAEGWNWTVYSPSSPLHKTFAKGKLNPAYPSAAEIDHDRFWSLVSTAISSVFEVTLLTAWASGWDAKGWLPRPAWETWFQGWAFWHHTPTLLALLTMPYIRIVHFWCVHRLMHPWRTTTIPDVGKFLYKQVHSLHHMSKNPTAWSGISMHPVESTLYYTAALMPVVFGAHPLVFLLYKVDLSLAALWGHDGHVNPGAGSQPHWLHHNNFECNYGEGYVPLDWLTGNFAANEEDFAARLSGRVKGGVPTDGSGKEIKAD